MEVNMKRVNMNLDKLIEELIKLQKQGYGKLPIGINTFEYEIINVEYDEYKKPHIEVNVQ
jgi:hypothetical protein